MTDWQAEFQLKLGNTWDADAKQEKQKFQLLPPWISLFQSNHWISDWSCSPTAAVDLIDICLVDAPYVTAHCGLYAGFWANKEMREQSVQVPSQYLEGGINFQMHQWCPCWSKSHSCFSIYIYICVCAFYFIIFFNIHQYSTIISSSAPDDSVNAASWLQLQMFKSCNL